MRSDTFDTVCSFDPALDKTKLSAEEFSAYLGDRSDLSKIAHAFVGIGPTLFTIREIPYRVWETFVDRGVDEKERHLRAFMAGVSRVRNIHQADGTVLTEEWRGTETIRVDGGQIDVMQERDVARFSPAERQEIGMVAYLHSFLPRRIASAFPLPPTSLQMLQRQAGAFRSAE